MSPKSKREVVVRASVLCGPVSDTRRASSPGTA